MISRRSKRRRHSGRRSWPVPLEVLESNVGPQATSGFFWHPQVERPDGPWTSHYQRVLRTGLELPGAEQIDDTQLRAKLQALLTTLARLNVFLVFTNHLDDRSLYRRLTEETLHDRIRDTPLPTGSAFVLFMLNMHKRDHEIIYLTYYATDEERLEWQRHHPRRKLPARKQPPSQRDASLPKPGPDFSQL